MNGIQIHAKLAEQWHSFPFQTLFLKRGAAHYIQKVYNRHAEICSTNLIANYETYITIKELLLILTKLSMTYDQKCRLESILIGLILTECLFR